MSKKDKSENKDVLVFEGEVVETSRDYFKVRISENYTAKCRLSGKIRQAAIKILLGDKVQIETSPYSPELGRIVYRLK